MYVDIQIQLVPVRMFKGQNRLRPILKSLVVEFPTLVSIAVGRIQRSEVFLVVVMVFVVECLS